MDSKKNFIGNLTLPDTSAIADTLAYSLIWQNSSKKSFISGMWLRTFYGTDIFLNCFCRVLNPFKYPYFMHYLKNIVLTSPGEHALWHQGTDEDRINYSLTVEQQSRGRDTADWDKMRSLAQELEAEYKKYFPSTRGMIIGYRYSLEEQTRILGKLNKKFLAEQK
jgi:hypothetical protein